MGQVVYPNVGAMTLMDVIRLALADAGAGPPAITCTVRLFKNDLEIGPSTVLADLTEADFSGYAAKTITALLPTYIDPDGGASAQIATQQFQHNGGVVSNICYGFYVLEDGGGLILVGKFDAPVPMATDVDAIPLDIKFNFGG